MNNDAKTLLSKTKKGFATLTVNSKYQKSALKHLQLWLTRTGFEEYRPQIEHIIENKDWDYLLDCFYQVIPFGTGGRRGEVGIGPNRINKWTIQASAQGHSQYLIKKHNHKAKEKGIVIAYGVREFFTNEHFNNKIKNPVRNLKAKDLAYSAAQVYTANNIKTYIFDGPRTTPELSFAIRHLGAIAGDMIDASHNPPEHNGKKVYDQYGGQLIPPHDEELVKEVTQKVEEIKTKKIDDAKNKGLFIQVGSEVDKSYVSEIVNLSQSDSRNIDIVYTPLHGTGKTSIQKSLETLGFKIDPDPKTSYQSGKFENITFNIPNPEVEESFDTTLNYAKEKSSELLLNSDPDADRIGVMVKHKDSWKYLNGNEIGAILVRYIIDKRKNNLSGQGIVIKTSVTTNLATKICEANGVKIIGDLLVGFKYIGQIMNELEEEGNIENFLFGLEESHGYIAGNYVRDKDAAVGALWLAELAAELKEKNKTLVDYLNETYAKYGYFRNYLTEIRLPGAEGMSKIQKIQDTLRKTKPNNFKRFEVKKIEDFRSRKPIVSQTDRKSKDVLLFHIKPIKDTVSMKVTVRPSGTEPKIKMYFEIGIKPTNIEKLNSTKERAEKLLRELEKAFMKHCYEILGVNFPERGFLLFWQLPLKDKLHYFEIEEGLAELKNINNKKERRKRLFEKLSFLGTDPVEKIDQAFKAKYNKPLLNYLELDE